MRAIGYTMLTVGAAVALYNAPQEDIEAAHILHGMNSFKSTIAESWPAEYSRKIQVAKLVPMIKEVDTAWEDMVAQVKRYEGFKAEAYLCPAGVRTIGYGHTGERVHGGTISEDEADCLLRAELDKTKRAVLRIVKVELSESQLAALVSFTYNCGSGALSKLVGAPGRLNDGNYESVSEIMPLYRRGGGRILDGLVKRRAWEVSLFEA